MAADIWGYCDECGRWFYCEGWRDGVGAQPKCPVCGTEASKLKHRTASST